MRSQRGVDDKIGVGVESLSIYCIPVHCCCLI